MTEEEKKNKKEKEEEIEEKEKEEKASEEEEVGELEEEEEEEYDEELEVGDIVAVPVILCPDDYEPMEIEGPEMRETEVDKAFFRTGTEKHQHLKYVCPVCERYYYHDLERKRQGCFIATAAYGTPFASDINVLRRFRDSYLVHRKWGKKLVSMYYTLSPPIADFIAKSEPLKKIVRTFLSPVVETFKRREKKLEE